jgi:vancomycin permeability regulator SanA
VAAGFGVSRSDINARLPPYRRRLEVRYLEGARTIRDALQPKDVFRSDPFDKADVAIVVGASDPDYLRHRITAGIALFTKKKVQTLLLCGDGRKKHPQGRTEADRMKELALQAGVPQDAIVLEDSNDDSAASAKECSQLLKTHPRLQGVRSVALVSSAWHTLRLCIVMKRYVPKQMALYGCPAAEGVTAANWQTIPQGRAIVDNELRLIEKLLKTGYSLK